METHGGYMGKVLKADLSEGTLADEPMDAEVLHRLVGGAGLAAHLLYHEAPDGIDPLDPRNPL